MAGRAGALIGAMLILAGVIFLLDAADVVPARQILGNWWPLVIVALGLFAMFSRARSLTGGGILVVIGLVLLLATLDILDVALWQLIIPVILIAAGIILLLRGLKRRMPADSRNRLSTAGVLTEQRVISEADAFRSASLTSILGEVKLDLRNARLDPSGAHVDLFCMLGDVHITVPRDWRVTVDGLPILADFEDKTEHRPDLPDDAPLITVTGVSILADVSVRNG